MSFKHFIKELNGNRVEGELVKTMLYALLTSFVFLGLLYYFKFRFTDGFLVKYGSALFFSALSYALMVSIVKQVRAYENFACMSGMMIGMTSGMFGFLPGFFVASTNGMFIGGFFGVAVGIFLGVLNGKCCGIMGVMEGIMAGFMGGLMGAMTAFMLLNDNLQLTSIFVFIISAVILIGLNYMIYTETKERERDKNNDHFVPLVINFILLVVTTYIVIFGPRSALFN